MSTWHADLDSCTLYGFRSSEYLSRWADLSFWKAATGCRASHACETHTDCTTSIKQQFGNLGTSQTARLSFYHTRQVRDGLLQPNSALEMSLCLACRHCTARSATRQPTLFGYRATCGISRAMMLLTNAGFGRLMVVQLVDMVGSKVMGRGLQVTAQSNPVAVLAPKIKRWRSKQQSGSGGVSYRRLIDHNHECNRVQ
eukprot:SAG31_NODE_2518_length_5574_cov_9.105205_2_plen_198_part_00